MTTTQYDPDIPAPTNTLAERVRDLLSRVALEVRPCRACGMKLYFVTHTNGKVAPYTADAVNHFINCPKASQFKRG
jgi:uncharacterized protein with PIN domain